MKRCPVWRLSGMDRRTQDCNQKLRTPGIEPGTIRYPQRLQSNALPTELCSVARAARPPKDKFKTVTHITFMQQEKRQRGDSNPRGQSPSDFESDSLTTRTHCLWSALPLREEDPKQIRQTGGHQNPEFRRGGTGSATIIICSAPEEKRRPPWGSNPRPPA